MTDKAARVMALKPCPFCGGVADIQNGHHHFDDVFIECSSCTASGPLFDNAEGNDAAAKNLNAAITAWNTRAEKDD